jgi:hypothetical protein
MSTQEGQLQDQKQTLKGIQGGVSALFAAQKKQSSYTNSRIADEAAQLGLQLDAMAQQLALVVCIVLETLYG